MSPGSRGGSSVWQIEHLRTNWRSPFDISEAGPSLYGVFGRQAGTLQGYSYSDALSGSQLVWEDQTIDKLFELGPDHFTPGSKMPMQRIAQPADRQDLIAYLRDNTGPRSGPPPAGGTK